MPALVLFPFFLSTPSASAEPCPNQALRVGSSALLPDCRAYEQVSPPETGGVDAISLQPLFPAQAASCAWTGPCSLLYMNATSAFAGALGNEPPNAYLASRASSGWSTLPLAPAITGPSPNTTAEVAYTPSTDLSQIVLRVPLQQLTPGAPAGVYNLYLRHADGSYALITALAPPIPPTPGCSSCFTFQDVASFAGASSDFSRIFFEANDGLTDGAPGPGVDNLYETEIATGSVDLVGILPDGTASPQGASVGGGLQPNSLRSGELERAISVDGSHVLFEANADGGAPDPQQAGKTELYDRIDGSTTVEISAPAPGAQPPHCETTEGICDPQPAHFLTASADGSLVYFTSSAALTRESNVGSEQRTPEEIEEEEIFEEEKPNPGTDLYRYDLSAGTLSDLTVDRNPEDPNGAQVLGVLGSSVDGSIIYFVARGDLAPGATSGQPNLYLWRGGAEGPGTTTFIATLDEPTEAEVRNAEKFRAGTAIHYNSDLLDWTSHPTLSQAYVTPDGKHLAFMSVIPLTGYDNTDQATGRPDHEVFAYNAQTAELTCASCDPSGERPLGSAFLGARLTERVSTPFNQPRAISDDGARLFFSSPDPLVPGTQPGHVKVFEYEGGLIRRISAAAGTGDDVFLDAGASGDDVFFATRTALVPGTEDELASVYDARVEGGIAPPPAPQAPCTGEACQGPPSTPPSWPTPSSASFTGAGKAAHRSHHLTKCKKRSSPRRQVRCLAGARGLRR